MPTLGRDYVDGDDAETAFCRLLMMFKYNQRPVPCQRGGKCMLIGLLTDFGMSDAYVGAMKGVILSIAPSAQIVDITHAIQPQNIRQAALTLKSVYRYFPKGTIFVVVVDPGVGSARRPIAVRAGDFTFIAPDNGVLSYTLAEIGDYEVVTLQNPAYRLAEPSSTFHGRDIFAPAAAHLAAGVDFHSLGLSIDGAVMLDRPMLRMNDRQIRGEVTHIDHFGNIVTSIGEFRWTAPNALSLTLSASDGVVSVSADRSSVAIGAVKLTGIKRTYSEAEPGVLLALIGSSGYLEIAINQGNAARRLNAEIRDLVTLEMG
jgi:S-adenosylmethionine hydrolase